MKINMLRRFGVLAVIVTLSAASALADPLIDFIGKRGGTISTGGVGTNLVGTNINIFLLQALEVPLNENDYDVSNGKLSFSVPVTSYSNGTWTYGKGGTFSITGSIPTIGVAGSNLLYNGTLYDGSFSLNGSFVNLLLAGVNQVNSSLLTYFGVPDQTFAFNGFVTATTVGSVNSTTGAFTANALSTDVANTSLPEPSAIVILGTGLLLIPAMLRRHLARGN